MQIPMGTIAAGAGGEVRRAHHEEIRDVDMMIEGGIGLLGEIGVGGSATDGIPRMTATANPSGGASQVHAQTSTICRNSCRVIVVETISYMLHVMHVVGLL